MKYEFVQTIQVGQHILSDNEQIFIDNICKHATVGIIMTWSDIGQGGFLHVNNRDKEYLIGKIQKCGFKHNKE